MRKQGKVNHAPSRKNSGTDMAIMTSKGKYDEEN